MADGADPELENSLNLGESSVNPQNLKVAPQNAEWQGIENRRDNLDVFIDENAIQLLKSDLKQRGSRDEAAGFLIGRYSKDHDTGKDFTKVIAYAAFPDDLTSSTPTSVSIGNDAFSYVRRYLEILDDPTLIMVGWAHSHPHYGLFLSTSDDSVNNFYLQDGMMAIVYDPHKESGANLAVFSKGGSTQADGVPAVRVEFGHGFRRHNGFFVYKEPEPVRVDIADESLKIDTNDLPVEPSAFRINRNETYAKGLRGKLQLLKDRLAPK